MSVNEIQTAVALLSLGAVLAQELKGSLLPFFFFPYHWFLLHSTLNFLLPFWARDQGSLTHF